MEVEESDYDGDITPYIGDTLLPDTPTGTQQSSASTSTMSEPANCHSGQMVLDECPCMVVVQLHAAIGNYIIIIYTSIISYMI